MKSTLSMVWHIFKKDCRLLWPFCLGVAGIQFAAAGLRYSLDHGEATETLSVLFQFVVYGAILAAGLLITAAVHQDAIPGVRQDWLARPIRRRDLLLAKLFFVVAMVHGPILLADTMQGLVNGFPLSQSLAAGATRGVYLLLSMSLPVLAFASLTRNMTEAMIAGVATFVGIAVLGQLLFADRLRQWPAQSTGLTWIAHSAVLVVLLAGASTILAVQYFRRKTTVARCVTVALLFLGYMALFLPWQFAFALQQRFSPIPGAGRLIIPTYESSLGRFRLPAGMNRHFVVGPPESRREEASTVYVPVHVAGLPNYALLNADKSEVHLLTADGKVLYRGPGDDLLIRKEGQHDPVRFTIGSRWVGFVREIGTKDLSVPQDNETWIYQGIALPRGLYDRVKNQPLRLEVDYSLTLLQGDSYSMPALGGDQFLPGVGRCTTKMDEDGDDIYFRCIQPGRSPFCASAFVEHAPSGQRNPAVFSCRPYYAPFLDQVVPDGMARFSEGIRFHDLAGMIRYPVDVSQVSESRLVIRVYHAQDHFTRQLVIPEIRLSDWESVERSN